MDRSSVQCLAKLARPFFTAVLVASCTLPHTSAGWAADPILKMAEPLRALHSVQAAQFEQPHASSANADSSAIVYVSDNAQPSTARQPADKSMHPTSSRSGALPANQRMTPLRVPQKSAKPIPVEKPQRFVAVSTDNPPQAIRAQADTSRRAAAATDRPDPPARVSPAATQATTARLKAIVNSAEGHNRYGFQLAGRGALFSAEEQFVQSLTLISQCLDVLSRSRGHGRALAAALTALEEADDFSPGASSALVDVDVQESVAIHRTPVLKETDTQTLTSLIALQAYYQYAQEQLALAGGRQPVASKAMYGMGRVHAYLAENGGIGVRLERSKATVFYRAAVTVDPRNYLAANELGVLLAQHGQLNEALAILQQSLEAGGEPTTWRNLAAVFRRQGQTDREALALRNYQIAVARQPSEAPATGLPDASSAAVRWVSHTEFADQSRVSENGIPISNLEKSDTTPTAPRVQASGEQQNGNAFTRLLPGRLFNLGSRDDRREN